MYVSICLAIYLSIFLNSLSLSFVLSHNSLLLPRSFSPPQHAFGLLPPFFVYTLLETRKKEEDDVNRGFGEARTDFIIKVFAVKPLKDFENTC